MVVFLLPAQHIDVCLELVVVSHCLIVGRYGLVKVRLQVLDLGMQHHVMSLAIFPFELVEATLLPVVLLSDVLEGVFDGEVLSFLLF